MHKVKLSVHLSNYQRSSYCLLKYTHDKQTKTKTLIVTVNVNPFYGLCS